MEDQWGVNQKLFVSTDLNEYSKDIMNMLWFVIIIIMMNYNLLVAVPIIFGSNRMTVYILTDT